MSERPFRYLKADGILGLGLPELSVTLGFSFLYNLRQRRQNLDTFYIDDESSALVFESATNKEEEYLEVPIVGSITEGGLWTIIIDRIFTET